MPTRHASGMDIERWLRARGGIAHREALLAAGCTPAELERCRLPRVRRFWLALPGADPALRVAASHRGRLDCVSAAEHWGLALLHPPAETHLWAPEPAHVETRPDVRWHRGRLLGPRIPRALIVSEVDALAHVAECLPRIEALIVWESALRQGRASPTGLRRVAWTGRRARRLAAEASAHSDSLLETITLHGLRDLGLPVRQQVKLLGHHVDFLIGARLVVQADGYAFHADARQRAADLRHDARLLLAGYRVLRFSYEDIVHRWDDTVRVILAAVAQGLAA